jgi:hypothetical protein
VTHARASGRRATSEREQAERSREAEQANEEDEAMSGYHMRGKHPRERKTAMSDEVVGSKLPALDGYGRNGFQGPSSVPMGKQPTASAAFKPKGSDPASDIKAAAVGNFEDAERVIKSAASANVPPAFGHRDRTSDQIISVPSKTNRAK